jgi:hypothetical protein
MIAIRHFLDHPSRYGVTVPQPDRNRARSGPQPHGSALTTSPGTAWRRSQEAPVMSRSRNRRRAAVLAVVAPLLSAGLIVTAGSAGAIPFEGEPSSTGCVRVVALPDASASGSTLFVSHGFAAVLAHGSACSAAET